tara:strand:+ start:8696 stop:9349 length:654 start_codon:yes stop_codon:yes gene_type:complete
MVKLYYGNGECTIEGSQIRGVEIRYSGNVAIQSTAGDNFFSFNLNQAILIIPAGGKSGYLKDLFMYHGDLKINSIIVAGENGERLSCKIIKVVDFAEFLDTNAEELTTLSENINSTLFGRKRIIEKKVIENLNTTQEQVKLFLEDGSPYSGYFHIHIESNKPMTGAIHSKKSKMLYVKSSEIPEKYIRKQAKKMRFKQNDIIRIQKNKLKKERMTDV